MVLINVIIRIATGNVHRIVTIARSIAMVMAFPMISMSKQGSQLISSWSNTEAIRRRSDFDTLKEKNIHKYRQKHSRYSKEWDKQKLIHPLGNEKINQNIDRYN